MTEQDNITKAIRALDAAHALAKGLWKGLSVPPGEVVEAIDKARAALSAVGAERKVWSPPCGWDDSRGYCLANPCKGGTAGCSDRWSRIVPATQKPESGAIPRVQTAGGGLRGPSLGWRGRTGNEQRMANRTDKRWKTGLRKSAK